MHEAICFAGGLVVGATGMWVMAKAIVIQYRERIVEGDQALQRAQLALNTLRRNVDMVSE